MVDFNPFLPDVRDNPYPAYRALREEDPVYWSDLMQGWLLTRYADVLAVLRDVSRFSSERDRSTNMFVRQIEESQRELGPVGRARTMLGADPPEHTRLRNLVNKAFTPRVVEKMRPAIQEIADELLDAAIDGGRLDVIRDLAAPLPVIVIAGMLGVPREDRARFKAWSDTIAASVGGPFQPAEAVAMAHDAAHALGDYFRKVIAKRRKDPRDDLISGLVVAEERGDMLSEDELLAACILLLVAGNETTTNLIGNGMLALMRNPDELRRLQSDPSLMPAAVEELLRYDSPVQATSRVAAADADLDGRRIEKGQIVITFLGAANRDPAQFPNPDRLDLSRADNRHVSFGYGSHFCVGAPLARVEAQIAFTTLLRRLPDPQPEVDKPEWRGSFILRGLRSLPMGSRAAVRG